MPKIDGKQPPTNNHQRGTAAKYSPGMTGFLVGVFNPFEKNIEHIFISQTGSFWQGLLVKIRNSFKPPPSFNMFSWYKHRPRKGITEYKWVDASACGPWSTNLPPTTTLNRSRVASRGGGCPPIVPGEKHPVSPPKWAKFWSMPKG